MHRKPLLFYADTPIDTFANKVIPWAQTVDATVNPYVAGKCEYCHEMVVEASKHRELHSTLNGGRLVIVYPNPAQKAKSISIRDRWVHMLFIQALNECTKYDSSLS